MPSGNLCFHCLPNNRIIQVNLKNRFSLCAGDIVEEMVS